MLRCKYHFVEHTSGVGVLDKAVLVLDAVHGGATTLAALTERTGLSRATTHRLAVALEVHRLLAKDSVDERIREVQENKALLFDAYARESDAKDADTRAVDAELHRPPELDDAGVPLERRVILAEEFRLSRNAGDLR